jgi:uncharacterized membrane protein YcaP (DUF421 family)
MDWKSILPFTMSPLEIILRGSLVFLGVTAVVRLSGRRQTGAVAVVDLLVVVFLADAVQNGMAGGQKSVADALLLATTIVAWDRSLDWLAFRIPWVARVLQPAPLPLIRDGRMLRQNMRQELITVEELNALLREQGVEEAASVRLCFLEGDGHISVIPFEPASGGEQTGGTR